MDKNTLSVIDADSHVFEPPVIWEKYLDPAYRVAARSAFYYHEDEFAAGVVLNGRQAPLMHTGRLNRSAIWRPGMTPEKLVTELDQAVQVPGLTNIWVPPIRNRIDMLATGIKSPVGVKVAGTDLREIDRVTDQIARVVQHVPGVTSAFAERLTGGRYVASGTSRRTPMSPWSWTSTTRTGAGCAT